ncbi:MAG: sterol desaturase/sphingolipid hydroxylase (fatty acid hydroxylase superfamily) [Marivirga sp.]|jgi:sterol desaturase/sphingolipid hydroxylase (fatty acid hydroxylase superfamily)
MKVTDGKEVKDTGTKQLFRNPILERLSRSHFSIPLTILLAIAVFLSYRGLTTIELPLASFLVLFISGYFSWTLGEYLIHRYLFHMADDKKWKRAVQYTFHGIHHEYPKDKDRIVMPPAGAILLGSIIFLGLWAVMRDYAFAFVPGFLTGYITYSFLHYAIHAYQPPKNFLKWLWIYHSIHHYKHPDKYFGVSSPFWDFIFKSNKQEENKN